MKDSRIGTYGSVGLLLILLIKFFSINSIETSTIPIIIINAHAFSRIFPVLMIYTSSYSRMDASSKTKPVGKRGTIISMLFAILSGLILLYFINYIAIILAITICLSIFFVFRRYILKRIDGYTGDVLGALQQLSEIGFYISYLIYIQVFI